jgi:hypothetical protein
MNKSISSQLLKHFSNSGKNVGLVWNQILNQKMFSKIKFSNYA